MPIIKVQDSSRSDSVSGNHKRPALNREGSESSDPEAPKMIFKLKPTGLLQEHLKRDAGIAEAVKQEPHDPSSANANRPAPPFLASIKLRSVSIANNEIKAAVSTLPRKVEEEQNGKESFSSGNGVQPRFGTPETPRRAELSRSGTGSRIGSPLQNQHKGSSLAQNGIAEVKEGLKKSSSSSSLKLTELEKKSESNLLNKSSSKEAIIQMEQQANASVKEYKNIRNQILSGSRGSLSKKSSSNSSLDKAKEDTPKSSSSDAPKPQDTNSQVTTAEKAIPSVDSNKPLPTKPPQTSNLSQATPIISAKEDKKVEDNDNLVAKQSFSSTTAVKSIDVPAKDETVRKASTASSIVKPIEQKKAESPKLTEFRKTETISTPPKAVNNVEGVPKGLTRSVSTKEEPSERPSVSSKRTATNSENEFAINASKTQQKPVFSAVVNGDNAQEDLLNSSASSRQLNDSLRPSTPGVAKFAEVQQRQRVVSDAPNYAREKYETYLFEDDDIKEIQQALDTQGSLFDADGKATLRRKRVNVGSMIVSAVQAFISGNPDELQFEQGDVLLVTETAKDENYYVARHEATGKSGLVRKDQVRELDSFFAEIVALTNQFDQTNENGRYSFGEKSLGNSDTQNSDKWKLEYGDQLSTLSDSFLPLKDIAKNSRFNASIEAEIGSRKQRSRTPTLENTWASRVGKEVTKLVHKEESKRQESIYEYIETEKAFVDDMTMVLDGYVKVLRESRVLTEAETNTIFSNLARVVEISTQFSSALNERQMSTNGVVDRVGDILLRELPTLREFAPFCSNLAGAVQFIQEKKKQSSVFAEKLLECSKNPYFGNMDLNSYILKPMQRITKVPLLIKGIMKHTPKDSPDYADLVQAEAVSQEILLYINTKCGESDERRKLEKIQKKLNNDLMQDLSLDYLDSKNRRIIFGGPVELDKKIFAYLFEDILVFVSLKSSNKTEKYSLHKAPVSLWLAETFCAESSIPPRLQASYKKSARRIKDASKAFTIYDYQTDSFYDLVADTNRERDSWMSHIASTKKTLHDTAKLNLNIWKPIPSLVPHKGKKFVPVTFNCMIKVHDYVLLSHDGGLMGSPIDDLTDFKECPGFTSRVGQMIIDSSTDMIFMIQGSQNSIEAYPVDNFNLLLTQLFDSKKKGSAPGMKLTKISCSNVKIMQTGMLFDTMHLLAATPKSFCFFQWIAHSKQYKKINEFPQQDAGLTTSICFLDDKFSVALGGKFYFLSTRDGSLKEIIDSSLSTADSNVAIRSFYTNDQKLLLCYDSKSQ